MSEHQAYERQLGAPARTQPRGRFRPDAEGNDIALPLYRHPWHPLAGYLTENAVNPRTGKPIPRVNMAKRASRLVNAAKGAAL